jgi:hypothetical protein
MHRRSAVLLLLVLVLAVASGCAAFQEYLLSGEATLTGALTLQTNGRGFDSASLSVERGSDTANEGRASLRQLQGCTVDLIWDIDRTGQATVKSGSQLSCPTSVTPLSGTIDLRDYAVDDVDDTGAKVTIGADGVRDPSGGAVLSGSTTLAFGTLANGAGGGAGGGGGGAAGGCDLTWEGRHFVSTWARCPRAQFVGSTPEALDSYPSDLAWEVQFARYNGERTVVFHDGPNESYDAFSNTDITVTGETFNVSVTLRDTNRNPRGVLSGRCTCNDY